MSWFKSLSPRFVSSSARRPRPTRLRVESFEDRVVPASVVNATLSAGLLTLTAVDAASSEDLVFTNGAVAGTINVAGTGATTLKFGAMAGSNLDFAGVKSVNIVLKGAADSVNLQGIFLSGNLSINGGDGGGSLNLSTDTHVGGSVTITNGNGGLDVVNVNHAFIGKNLIVNQGAGADSSLLQVFGGSFIGGYMKATGGAGHDQVDLLNGSFVGQSLTASLGAGDDSFSIVNSTVGTTVTVALGENSNEAEITGSHIGGNLSVTAGAGADTLKVDGTSVAGSLTATLGDGADDVDLSDLFVGVNTTVGLGNGVNSLDIDANGTGTVGSILLGSLSVTGGTGIDSVSLGSDNPLVVGGGTKMALGSELAGGDKVLIDDTTFMNTVKIDLAGGNDELSVESLAGTVGANTTFANKLTVTMGAGSDTAKFGVNANADRKVLFNVAPAIDGGAAGTDVLNRNNGTIGGVDFTGLAGFFTNFETVTP